MMKKNKKFIALFLAAVFTVQFCSYAAAAAQPVRNINKLSDVSQNDWYYIYVKRLYEDGMINGVTDNTYAPNADVKTSELSALIVRYLGLERAAEKSRDFLIKNKIEGGNLWYSGYIQLLFDSGIFGDSELIKYGVKLTDAGSVVISANAAAFWDSPVKRMDVIKYIAKSFEIKKDGVKTKKLKSEISGNGNEFISGGGYDRETLEKIREMMGDYYDIPEEYREFFLKCYYNGIIRGNENREVLPYNNLKRSEFAKMIAAVIYFDLREKDIRDIPEICAVTPGDYSISSVDGSLVLKKEKAEKILREQAKNITTSEIKDKNAISVVINQKNIIPMGYLNEIYVYRYEGGVALEMGRVNCAANADEYFPKQNVFSVSKTNIKSANDFAGYVYLVLRDLNRNGEIVGAVMFNIDAQGDLKDAPVYYLP